MRAFTAFNVLQELSKTLENTSFMVRSPWLVEAIVRYGPRSNNTSAVFKVLHALAQRPENKAPVLRTPGLLDYISSVVTSKALTQRNLLGSALNLLESLAADPSNRKLIYRAPGLVDTAVSLVVDLTEPDDKVHALGVLSALATEAFCAGKMIQIPGFVEALVSQAGTNSDESLEDCALVGLSALASAPEHADALARVPALLSHAVAAVRGGRGRKRACALIMNLSLSSPKTRAAVVEADGLVDALLFEAPNGFEVLGNLADAGEETARVVFDRIVTLSALLRTKSEAELELLALLGAKSATIAFAMVQTDEVERVLRAELDRPVNHVPWLEFLLPLAYPTSGEQATWLRGADAVLARTVAQCLRDEEAVRASWPRSCLLQRVRTTPSARRVGKPSLWRGFGTLSARSRTPKSERRGALLLPRRFSCTSR